MKEPCEQTLKETQSETENTEINQICQFLIFSSADQRNFMERQYPMHIEQPQQMQERCRQSKSLNQTTDAKQIDERKQSEISTSRKKLKKILFSCKELGMFIAYINKCPSNERKIYRNKQYRDETSFTFYTPISRSEISAQEFNQIYMETFKITFEEENLLQYSQVSKDLLYETFRKCIFQNHKIFIWKLSQYEMFSLNKATFKKLLKTYDISTIEMTENKLLLIDNRKDQQKQNVYTLNIQTLGYFADASLKPLNHITIDLQKLKTLSKMDQQKYKVILKKLMDLTQQEVEMKYLFQEKDAKVFMKFLKEDSFINALTEIIKQQCQYLIDFNEVDQKQLLYIEQLQNKNQMSQNKSQSYSFKVKYDSWQAQSGPVQKENAIIQFPVVSLIRSANRHLRKSNLYALNELWKNDLSGIINSCLKNWSIYSPFLEQELTEFTLLAQTKIQRFNYNDGATAILIYEKVYEGITDLVNKLQRFFKLNYYEISLPQKQSSPLKQEGKRSNIKQLSLAKTTLKMEDDSISQKVLDFYIQQKQLFKKNKKLLAVKLSDNKKQSLRQYISDKITFAGQLSQFRNLFSILTYEYSMLTETSIKETKETNSGNQISSTESFKKISNDNYFQNIKKERLPQTRCLGCSPFFIQGMNVLDETVNSTPLRVFLSVQKMKDFQLQIKDQMCAMLNSGGGIILFDCIRQYQTVKIKGIKLTEKEKQQYQQRLISYMDVFQPKIQARKCIKISFVPIVANKLDRNSIPLGLQSTYEDQSVYFGEEGLLKPNQIFKTRDYFQKTYILRIRVCPINGLNVYFWRQANNRQLRQEFKNYVCTTRKEAVKSTIKMKNLAREIKKKMKMHYIPSHKIGTERALMMKPYSFFNHQCKSPDTGVGNKINCDEANDQNRQRQPKNAYLYATMLISKKSHLPQIKKVFKQKGVDCSIEVKFQSYKFKSANHTALMYHNAKFEELLNMVADNSQFELNGKQLLLISITNYLKLSHRNQNNPYSYENYKTLTGWMEREYSKKNVKVFEFNNLGNKEYFLQFQNYEATLFAYYTLNNYSEKTVFKNPLHLDKMNEQQKQCRFIQLYAYNSSDYGENIVSVDFEQTNLIENVQYSRDKGENIVNLELDPQNTKDEKNDPNDSDQTNDKSIRNGVEIQ